MGNGSALKTLLLNIQFDVLVKTIDWYIYPANSYNLVAKTLPVERCACVSCGAPLTRENDIRWKSFTFVIWRRLHARCCRYCPGPAPAPANSLFLLPASPHISPSPKQCKQKKLLSVPPHNIAHSVAGCLLVPWWQCYAEMLTPRLTLHLDAAHSTN